jgi:LmbE family N-acetylglucosaminyl deacetylase
LVEAEWAAGQRALPADIQRGRRTLATLFGPAMPADRAPRILGLFAHPDDEVFCVGGTMARCSAGGAVTAIASLTRGEVGQIRDAYTATRRTLGPVRVKELEQSASELGVDEVICLDLGDGQLAALPLEDVARAARRIIDDFAPDVVVTFGPDGGFGHPDHVTSCLAVMEAVRTMADPPRVLHAKFPLHGDLMVDVIADWLRTQPKRFRGTSEFGHALKLFADGTSMLGMAADNVSVEWFPPGSFIIEQDEPATELYCILSGTADVVVERDDGVMEKLHRAKPGSFFGEDGIATGLPRNAHVIARDAVTCLVLAAGKPSPSAARGGGSAVASLRVSTATGPSASIGVEDCLIVDVRGTLDRKVAALAAHRSQYAGGAEILPPPLVERLLGSEHFVVAAG